MVLSAERSSLAFLAGLGLLECASAFSPSLGSCPIARSSIFSKSVSSARASAPLLGLRMQGPGMDFGDAPLPDGQKAFVAKERTIDEW